MKHLRIGNRNTEKAVPPCFYLSQALVDDERTKEGKLAFVVWKGFKDSCTKRIYRKILVGL